MTINHSKIRKICVIKLRAIGDVLLSTAVPKNLRSAFPDARIDFCTEAPSRGIVEGNPSLDNLIIFDLKRESGGSLIRRVRDGNYDCVIDLFGNPRSAVVTLLSGARYRVGYRFGWRRFCYNVVIEPRGGSVHNVEFNLDALTRIGVPVIDRMPFLPVGREDELFGEKFWVDEKLAGCFVVAVNAGGGWYTKRWGIPRFAALADRIAESYNAKIILCWGPGEKEGAEQLKSSMRHQASLIPPSTLKQLAAILRLANVMVSNDSGPMHMAAVAGTPVLAIFGPTNPRFQGPVGDSNVVVRNESLDCLGCNLTACPIGLPCMEKLGVDEVMGGFDRLMRMVGRK